MQNSGGEARNARENGIIYIPNMSGEMHMRRRNEVFGCIPHGRGALFWRGALPKASPKGPQGAARGAYRLVASG